MTASRPRRIDAHDQVRKVTLRLPTAVAATLAARATAAGLSRGDYFATVLEGVPAPPLPVDHLECLAALGRSTDALAVVAKDMADLVRRSGDKSESATLNAFFTRSIVEHEVTTHLRLASQLLASSGPRQRVDRRRCDPHAKASRHEADRLFP